VPLLVWRGLVNAVSERKKEREETMAENDEKTRCGFLYYWANDTPTPTIKRIPCEVYSRIVGYVRPVQQWNTGKQQEWKDRKPYEQPLHDPR
jgi:anaerobic ribonucleoside-triphosphate reductase